MKIHRNKPLMLFLGQGIDVDARFHRRAVRRAGSKSRNHASRKATVTASLSAVAMRPGIDAL